MDHNNLLTNLYFNETFQINIDASAFQLGAVISQKVKLIDFYSRKLTFAQQRYTGTEKRPLSIVETLKKIRTILLGKKIRICTDNKHLTCKSFNNDRVLRWRLILEYYGPDIEYIKYEKNMVTDALSRFSLNVNQDTTNNSTYQYQLVSEINDIKEIPEGDFPFNLKLIAQYQWKETFLMAKY